jgi:peptidoglycan/xylan/chitin deacetylase (PgdA/CDA1 family)
MDPENERPSADLIREYSRRIVTRLLKFGGSILFHAATEIWRKLCRLTGRKLPPIVVVVYYHKVSKVERNRLARQLDCLMRWTRPMRVDDTELVSAGTRFVTITADDGWLSFAENGVPELARRRIPLTLFAISNRLGSTIDGTTNDRLVTADELCRLKSDLITIGSHTATHRDMTTLDEYEALLELRESRTKLTDIISEDVKLFCFPYGAYSEKLIALCREAGYEHAFTGMPELANPQAFVIGRVRVDPADWAPEFYLKIMGAYRWIPGAIALKRRILNGLHGQSPGFSRLRDPL